MEGFSIDLKTFSLTNTPKVSESKYQAGFGVIILGQNPQTFIYIVLLYFMINCILEFANCATKKRKKKKKKQPKDY